MSDSSHTSDQASFNRIPAQIALNTLDLLDSQRAAMVRVRSTLGDSYTQDTLARVRGDMHTVASLGDEGIPRVIRLLSASHSAQAQSYSLELTGLLRAHRSAFSDSPNPRTSSSILSELRALDSQSAALRLSIESSISQSNRPVNIHLAGDALLALASIGALAVGLARRRKAKDESIAFATGVPFGLTTTDFSASMFETKKPTPAQNFGAFLNHAKEALANVALRLTELIVKAQPQTTEALAVPVGNAAPNLTPTVPETVVTTSVQVTEVQGSTPVASAMASTPTLVPPMPATTIRVGDFDGTPASVQPEYAETELSRGKRREGHA